MVEDSSKHDEKFDFNLQGEAPGYISLDHAVLEARQLARQEDASLTQRFGWEQVVWTTLVSKQNEDSYQIVLQFNQPSRRVAEDHTGEYEFLFSLTGDLIDKQVITWPEEFEQPTGYSATAARSATSPTLHGAPTNLSPHQEWWSKGTREGHFTKLKKSSDIAKSLLFTQPLEGNGLHAVIESDSINVFGINHNLCFRGYVANQTGHAVFRPKITIAIKDRGSINTVVETGEITAQVLGADQVEPFTVFFIDEEYPPEWEIISVQVEEGDRQLSPFAHELNDDLDSCLYDDLELETSGLNASSALNLRLRVTNSGKSTSEFTQILFHALDSDGVYLMTMAAGISEKEHGLINPGESTVFEAESLFLYMRAFIDREQPKRSLGNIGISLVGLVPGSASVRPQFQNPASRELIETMSPFDTDIDIKKVS